MSANSVVSSKRRVTDTTNSNRFMNRSITSGGPDVLTMFEWYWNNIRGQFGGFHTSGCSDASR
jgi:hypothetical protein